MTLMTLDTDPAALPAPSETAFGLLTSPGKGARTVTRTGTARRERTDISRSLSGDIAVHHAALAMSGHPLALEESRPSGSVAGGVPTTRIVPDQCCDEVSVQRGAAVGDGRCSACGHAYHRGYCYVRIRLVLVDGNPSLYCTCPPDADWPGEDEV
jgi:hypothetical protein